MQTIKVIQQLDEFGKQLKEHLFQIPLGAEITDFRVGEIQILLISLLLPLLDWGWWQSDTGDSTNFESKNGFK